MSESNHNMMTRSKNKLNEPSIPPKHNKPDDFDDFDDEIDEHGNLIPDEIVALRFEKNDNNEETEEDD